MQKKNLERKDKMKPDEILETVERIYELEKNLQDINQKIEICETKKKEISLSLDIGKDILVAVLSKYGLNEYKDDRIKIKLTKRPLQLVIKDENSFINYLEKNNKKLFEKVVKVEKKVLKNQLLDYFKTTGEVIENFYEIVSHDTPSVKITLKGKE